MSNRPIEKDLKKAENEAASRLREVQESLAKVDRLLGEFAADDSQSAEQMSRRILPVLDKANQSLVSIQRDFALQEELATPHPDTARSDFRQRLELARLHLVWDSQSLSEKLESLRRRLEEEEKHSGSRSESETPSLMERFSGAAEELKPFLKAFFQHPDEASPDPPREGSGPHENNPELSS